MKYIPGNETLCLCFQNVSWFGFEMYLYHSRVLFRSITIYERIIFQEGNANQNLVRKQLRIQISMRIIIERRDELQGREIVFRTGGDR